MKRSRQHEGVKAQKISEVELEKTILEISVLLKDLRKERMSVEKFAYETHISRSNINKIESGGEMLLSTFLKVVYGLDIEPQKFFAKLNKKPR